MPPEVLEVLAEDVEVARRRVERRDLQLGALLAPIAVVVVAADVGDTVGCRGCGPAAGQRRLSGGGVADDPEDDRPRHGGKHGTGPRRARAASSPTWPLDAAPVVCALLDQLDLGQQVLGHAQRGGVDQAAVQRDGSLAVVGGLLHRLHDPARARDQPVIGREDLVRELDLAGVDAPLALEAEDRGSPGGDQVALGVAEVAERAVDRPQAVGPAGDGDPRQGVVPLVAPVQVPRPRRRRWGR